MKFIHPIQILLHSTNLYKEDLNFLRGKSVIDLGSVLNNLQRQRNKDIYLQRMCLI